MKRQLISADALNELLAAAAAKIDECLGCELPRVYLHEPDDSGCNWDISTWGGGRNVGHCKAAMTGYGHELRERYNLPGTVFD